MKRKHAVIFSLCAAMLLSTVGCGGQKRVNTELPEENKYDETYPINTDKTLSYWVNQAANQDYKTFRDQPFFKALMEQTGVDLDMTFVSLGEGGDMFNLMIASDNLPDLVGYSWLNATGGVQKYIDDEYILPLNDIIDRYAPNLKRYLEENEDIARMCRTDDGTYYMFPFVRESEYLTSYLGPVVRADLLEKYNISEPETIDEWEQMLKTFKENGIEAPLTSAALRYLTGAFDTWPGYYVRDGKVVFGPAEQSYKEHVSKMADWYAEGLIEKDIISIDNTIVNAKMSTSKSAVALGTGGQMGQWSAAGKNINPNFKLQALKYPTMKRGDVCEFGYSENMVTGWGVAISTKCEDVELAARFLDYAYSEEGHMLYNFGIEGESYEMVDGEPVYTQEMYEYTKGDLGTSISRYIWSIGSAACIQDERMYRQRMQSDEQREALEKWSKTNMQSHLMPNITHTPEESDILAQYSEAIGTYVDEMFYKFLFGQEDIAQFDKYVEQMKQMGLDEVLKVKQAALDRYYKR